MPQLIFRSFVVIAAALLIAFIPGTQSKSSAQKLEPVAAVETVPNVRNDASSLAFSDDGSLALTGSGSSGTVDIWDVRSGRLIRSLSGHRNEILAIAFVSDGRQILSASRDMTVKLWDTSTGRMLRTVQLSGETKSPKTMAISQDGSLVVSGTTTNDVKVWDAATGRLIRTFKSGNSSSVAFSVDGSRIASGGGQIRVWDLPSGRLIWTFNNPSLSLAFSHDGSRLVSGSYDKTVKMWDLASGRLLRTFVHPDAVTSVAISADGGRIASGVGYNDSPHMRVWDSADGKLLYTRQHSYGPKVLFSPDGKHLLSGNPGNPLQIKFWESETGSLARDFGGDTESLVGAIFSRDGSRVISGGVSLQQWDAGTAQLLNTSLAPEKGTVSLAFSHDGSRVVWKMPDEKTLRLADAAGSRKTLRRLLAAMPKSIFSVAAISPDGSKIASGGGFDEKTIKLWEASTGRPLRTIPLADARAISFSPDGTKLLAGSFNNTAELWDVVKGQRNSYLPSLRLRLVGGVFA